MWEKVLPKHHKSTQAPKKPTSKFTKVVRVQLIRGKTPTASSGLRILLGKEVMASAGFVIGKELVLKRFSTSPKRMLLAPIVEEGCKKLSPISQDKGRTEALQGQCLDAYIQFNMDRTMFKGRTNRHIAPHKVTKEGVEFVV